MIILLAEAKRLTEITKEKDLERQARRMMAFHIKGQKEKQQLEK